SLDKASKTCLERGLFFSARFSVKIAYGLFFTIAGAKCLYKRLQEARDVYQAYFILENKEDKGTTINFWKRHHNNLMLPGSTLIGLLQSLLNIFHPLEIIFLQVGSRINGDLFTLLGIIDLER
ncbi:hypothetical protein ACJX0J_033529, partial [Zea mays]